MSNPVNMSGFQLTAQILANMEEAFNPATGTYDMNLLRPFRINGQEQQGTFLRVNAGQGQFGKNKNLRQVRVNAADALLMEDYKAIDSVITAVNRERLTVADDIIGAGLTVGINQQNAMGSTIFQSFKESDEGSAYLTMTGNGEKRDAAVSFENDMVPLPFMAADAQFPARYLASLSRGVYGSGLLSFDGVRDMIEKRVRRMKELLEDMTIGVSLDGSGTALAQGTPCFSFGGASIYGYLNSPNTNTGSLTGAWTGLTGEQIVADITNMKAAMIQNKCFADAGNPRYGIYIPTEYEALLDRTFDTSNASNITIRDRIMKIAGIKFIKPVDRMPSGRVIMVHFNSTNIRMINAMEPSVLSFQHWTKLQSEYKILALQIPQIRADIMGNCGVVVFKTA